jgi:hypothetical protein
VKAELLSDQPGLLGRGLNDIDPDGRVLLSAPLVQALAQTRERCIGAESISIGRQMSAPWPGGRLVLPHTQSLHGQGHVPQRGLQGQQRAALERDTPVF